MELIVDYCDKLKDNFASILNVADDPALWALQKLNIDLYDNQIEIVNAVCDLAEKNIAILQARGAGKSFSVALGLVKICLDIPGVQIGIFGPKAEQANRIIKEITDNIISPSSPIHVAINWKESSKSHLKFLNGSEMVAISAAETTMQEGWHFNIVVLDECHRISDISANQRIIPMLGSLPIGKIIKLGISMYKQNFWKSCCAPHTPYLVLKRDWTECPILLVNGSVLYKGKELSRYVLDQMPLSMKERLFPDRPDLHYDGSMTELDFKVSYSMEWAADIDLELNESDQRKLVDSNHDILTRGIHNQQEMYFFGLDTASGTLLPGKKDLDWTALSIWRKLSNNVKEKVACYTWQGDPLDQVKEIRQIVHPQEGYFKCAFGLVDYSNIGINLVEQFKSEGLPIDGIMFKSTETASKKNFKNAMFDQFKFELGSGRVKFPSIEKMDPQPNDSDEITKIRVALKKSFNEWCHIERHKKLGINDDINAPSDLHDDHCSADVLAVWAMDKTQNFRVAAQTTIHIPNPITDVARVSGRGIPNIDTPKNRYLPNSPNNPRPGNP